MLYVIRIERLSVIEMSEFVTVLIFKTSTDSTMNMLLEELKDSDYDIDCLIQTSQVERYKALYPRVNFIDIQAKGFYDLPSDVMDKVGQRKYDQLYVTLSGVAGHNYGNVMSIVSKIVYKEAFFYNCNGEKITIPSPNFLKDFICRVYIGFLDLIYSRKGEV